MASPTWERNRLTLTSADCRTWRTLPPSWSNSANTAHGTHVASVAGGATDDNEGISSAGFNCSLDLATGGLPNVLALSADGVPVINNSWFYNCSPNMNAEVVCHEIYENGTATTWGAGNGNQHCNFNETYPPAYPHNMSVSSIGADVPYGQMSSWQGSGGPIAWNWQDVHWNVVGSMNGNVMTEIHNHNPAVDIVAPGYHVRVAVPTNPSNPNAALYVPFGHGTSFAAPQVAGTAGLMLSVNPCLSPYQIEVGLKTTARNIYNIPENQQFIGELGAGALNAGAAVAWAQIQDCNSLFTSTMVIKGIDINTLCAPGFSSNSVNPQLTPIIENGNPPYTYRWVPIPGNNCSLNATNVAQPEVTSSTAPYRLYYHLVVTDNSAVPKVAYKAIDVTLTTAQTYDLAMRDSYMDMLNEPNTQTQLDPREWSIWQSPDVWNRKAQDGGIVHQNPEYYVSQPNHAYARVRNVGCADNPAGKDLHLYWSLASTGEDWDQDWTVTNVPGVNGMVPGGREITTNPLPIPVIQPGNEWIAHHAWNPQAPGDIGQNLTSVDVCFLARIVESPTSPFGMAFPEVTTVSNNVRNNNNICTRNFIVTDFAPGNFGKMAEKKAETHQIWFANAGDERASFDLELLSEKDIHPQLSGDLASAGEIRIGLGKLYDLWVKAGRKGEFLEIDPKSKTVTFDGSTAFRLSSIPLQPGERYPIEISFAQRNPSEIPHYIHFRQYETGSEEVYGAISFEISGTKKLK